MNTFIKLCKVLENPTLKVTLQYYKYQKRFKFSDVHLVRLASVLITQQYPSVQVNNQITWSVATLRFLFTLSTLGVYPYSSLCWLPALYIS